MNRRIKPNKLSNKRDRKRRRNWAVQIIQKQINKGLELVKYS